MFKNIKYQISETGNRKCHKHVYKHKNGTVPGCNVVVNPDTWLFSENGVTDKILAPSPLA